MNLDDSRLPPRFWRKIFVDQNGCWIWTGAGTGKNRGQINWMCDDGVRRRVAVYRLTFKVANGGIDETPGVGLDHLCEVPACCNPAHLEQLTNVENARRHNERHPVSVCPHGHAKTDDNVYLRREGACVTRICKTCHTRRMRSYNERTYNRRRTIVPAARVTDARKSIGLTFAEFATAIGVSESAVYKWESGISHPKSESARRIATLIGCSVEQLEAA